MKAEYEVWVERLTPFGDYHAPVDKHSECGIPIPIAYGYRVTEWVALEDLKRPCRRCFGFHR